MRYPMINKKAHREIMIPELSGGLNLRDSLNGIRDNQLTDCINMWYKNGMLKTRPGFEYYNNIFDNTDIKLGVNSDYRYGKLKVHPEIINNDGSVLVSFKSVLLDEHTGNCIIYFWWQSQDKITKLSGFSTNDCNYFVVEKDGVLYCYLENYKIYKCEFASGGKEWELIGEDEIYTPTVMIHCQRTGVHGFTGTQFEGYNLLTPRFKVIYSAYNENDSDTSHPMRYNFGRKIAASGTIDVTFTYADANGTPKTCLHSIDASGLLNNEWVYESKPQEDGLAMYACKGYLGFSSENGSDTMPAKRLDNDSDVKKYGPIEDNLVIVATAEQSEEEKDKLFKKVFNMTQSIWFGGAAGGINGGSRLFLCGNTDESEKALIIWSGLNNPLYFNENNYAYIGNKAHPVTAFGKQGENLIIFKPNETFYSYYVQNSEIDADDLINQSVVDYEANSVFFPIITLHSYIGCDCPYTIQLCRNRLVWLNSDGKVYTLVSANQYSEMTIYSVSEMIEKKIKSLGYQSEQLKMAVSHDFDGYYVLIIEGDAYVMDYNSYGFTHIYSYSKKEDANIMIPWYFWKLLPNDCFNDGGKPHYCGMGNMIVAVYVLRESTKYFSACCSILKSNNDSGIDELMLLDVENESAIKKKPILSRMQTKLFDFSVPHYLKNVNKISVGFGNNGGDEIGAAFVTDTGTTNETVILTGNGTDESNAAYVTAKSFYPSARAVRNFGVKLECEGRLIVDSISLQYRLLGGAK